MTRLNKCLKSPVSEHFLSVSMPKGSKHCLNLHDSTFIIYFHHSGEIYLDNVSASDMWNLRALCQHIICPSKKQKNFSQIFAPFLKSTSNLKYFEKNMTLKVYIFPKLRSAKDVLRQVFKKPRFRKPFDSQDAKGSQTLLESPRQHFYHIFHHSGGDWVKKWLC